MNSIIRPRRLRRTEAIREMVRENHLKASDFIYPLFIHEKDLVIIDKNEPIKNGDIGAFLINNSEGTIKFLKNIQGKQYLVPANKNYEKIPVNENIQPIGKVVSLIRDM